MILGLFLVSSTWAAAMGSFCRQSSRATRTSPVCSLTSHPVAGSFFESVPQGADVYVLKKVIHDWNDKQAVAILRNCRDAVTPHGRVLVAETIIPAGNEPSPIKLIDANMLVVTGGAERTQAEYAALFAAAGLRLKRVISTSQPISVLEAGPI